MVEKDYYGFLDEVAVKLQAAQDPFSGQIRVKVKDVEKANGMSYRGIVVADDQLGMGVTINMDKHYKMYLAGKPVDEIVDLVQQQAMDAFEERPDVDISRMKDYESLCSNVMMEAVSREKNAEYLQDVPHFDMADLSIIYRVNVGESRNQGIGVITVDNRLLNSMGVSQDQFQKDVFDQVLSGDRHLSAESRAHPVFNIPDQGIFFRIMPHNLPIFLRSRNPPRRMGNQPVKTRMALLRLSG